MINEKYLKRLKKTVRKYFPEKNTKIFVYGSSVQPKWRTFADVDVGFLGENIDQMKLLDLQEEIEESTFPYFIDLVDFQKTDKDFSEHVLHKTPIVWI